MIQYVKGDLFESDAQALVNTVNTVGVMGKGIALQFKKIFPHNFRVYREVCKRNELHTGKMLVTRDSSLHTGEKIIVNFPTKEDWRKPSEYVYIEKGLDDLVRVLEEYQIGSIAIPPLGAGNGGLNWEKVKQLILHKLNTSEIDIRIYEPAADIPDKLRQERIPLSDARALLLYVLYDLVRNEAYVSEFSGEKVCYFMQRFGAEPYFKLTYTPEFYGPYSGKVRYLLSALNGSYLTGYGDMNKKPFDPLFLLTDSYPLVAEYINGKPELKDISTQTMAFLNGFYGDFSLELLSTIDYIARMEKSIDRTLVIDRLNQWSHRKRSLFSNPKYIDISIHHLKQSFDYSS
jgi:O-acetyl-ADP-ribose deacetylase (regulator of RNase III)